MINCLINQSHTRTTTNFRSLLLLLPSPPHPNPHVAAAQEEALLKCKLITVII